MDGGNKDWKPANDMAGIDCWSGTTNRRALHPPVGRLHAFIAEEGPGGLALKATRMEPMKVYNIPRGLWHNTVTNRK
jgi:hypothetical protein